MAPGDRVSMAFFVRPHRRRSLWETLSLRASVPNRTTAIYHNLARRLEAGASSVTAPGLWGKLALATDPRHYRPRQTAGVSEETIVEDGETFIALRSPSGGYLRLTPAEHALWAAMDGSLTIEQLAMLGFTRFRRLLPIVELVESLRQGGFLTDAPVGLYRELQRRLERRSVAGWGHHIAAMLRAYAIPISGIDTLVGAMYRSGGWIMFTRPFLVVLGLFILAGFAAFALTVGSGIYAVIDADNAGGSLLAFWAALLISFVLHELAHALAVKHFGRRVLRGGVMIYYGMPAAFVDTSDMWLAGRRARIIVSLAGPLCDLTVGSLAALAAALLPPGSMGGAAYTLAVAAYLAALCNLNPLLELDGYHILSDWLRQPNLRRQALHFISGPLWQKVRTRAPLTSEERIYAVYGLLSAAYTILALMLAFIFWQTHLARILGELWSGELSDRLLALLIGFGIVVPLGLGLLLAAWWLVHTAAAWVARRGYGRSPALVAAVLTLFVITLTLTPLRFGRTVETALIAPVLWLTALAAQVTLHADYRHAAVAEALDSFLIVTGLEVLALVGWLLFPAYALAWSLIQNIGFALLFFAGLIALLDVDLSLAAPWELVISAMLLVIAFLSSSLVLDLLRAEGADAPLWWRLIAAAPVYGGAIALALLLPLVASMAGSRLMWSWLLLWFGIAAQTAAYVTELLPTLRNARLAPTGAILASGLWTAAWCSHVVALRQISPHSLNWPLEPAAGEAERLQRAFRYLYAGIYLMFRSYHGARRARTFDDRMDVLAATANWDVTLDREEARIDAALAAAPLDVQAVRYAEVLRYAVAEVERLAGVTFARRTIQAAYDALPWPEREVAERRCLPHTPWAQCLSRALGDARAARLRLLREIERFAAYDDAELLTLAELLEPQRVPAGTRILAAEQPSPGLWIIEAGEVMVWEGGRVAAELHRGATFGDEAQGAPIREYRASVDSVLLFVSDADLRRFMAKHGVRSDHNRTAILRALERTPFFQALPRAALRELTGVAELICFPARTLIMRQGQPNDRIFVVVEGRVTVVRQEDGAAPRPVARLGPTELFGEVELLRPGPAWSSVVAITDVEAIALPHAAIMAILGAGGAAPRELHRIGSARLRGV